MRVELVNPVAVILSEIADKQFRRKNVAMTYAFCIRQLPATSERWLEINHAIMQRWSLSGLAWIKKEAWKRVEG